MKQLLISLLMLVAVQANAATININVSSGSVELEDSIVVTLVGDFAANEAFVGLNLDVLFDTSLFEYIDGTFSTDLPDDGFDYFVGYGPHPAGFGLTFDSFFDAFSGQLTLASFELKALQPGQTDLEILVYDIFDELLDTINVASQPVTITARDTVAASAPASLGLLFVAIAGLMLRRRK